MTIHRIEVGPLSTNCLFVIDDATRATLVVDPGGDGDALARRLRTLEAAPVMVVLTHGHFDHTLAASELARSFDVPIAMGAEDLPLYENTHRQVAGMFGAAAAEAALQGSPITPTRWLAHGDTIVFGDLTAQVLGLPGHSPGGIGLLLCGDPDVLVAGDTLFRDGVGRTDLWGGDESVLMRSIRERIWPLSDRTRVIPGHGPETTVGRERRVLQSL